jgi:hypothetical protein
LAECHPVFDKLRNIVIQKGAKDGRFILCDLCTRKIAFLRNCRGLQRAGALFVARPGNRNSRICVAQAMSPVDNFLQNQQK